MKVKVFHSDNQTEIKEINLTHLIREGESCFIGRSQYSGLFLDSPSVSRLHGRFSYQDGQYYFCDLGSSNGSVIQGETAEVNRDYLLQPGDVIRLGDFALLLEALPESPEELPQTVIGDVDATVISGYTNSTFELPIHVTCNDDDHEEDQPVIEVELVKHESSAIVKLTEVETDYNLQHQTRALFTAINQRVLAELRAAGSLTRDTYLKAIRKARKSIEQERLIDPDQFEKEAEKYWQSVARSTSELSAQIGVAAAKSASNLSQRLGAAAKAAWHEFLLHRPNTEKKLEVSSSKNRFNSSDESNNHSFDASSDRLSETDPSSSEPKSENDVD